MKTFLQKSYVISIYIFLYLPILVLILYSVNNSKFSMQWHGFTDHWYVELFHNDDLWQAFYHSVLLGVSASILATITGLLAAVYVFLHPSTNNRSLFAMLILLIIIPDLVFGVSLLIFFNLTGIPLGFLSLFIAHTTFCIPFVVFTIYSQIQSLDANIYYSALDLGASRLRALTKVLLPLLWPSILSALLLCYTLSFDDVVISYFVAGPDFNILPLTIYSMVRSGVTPEINALCSITFIITMFLVITAYKLLGKPNETF